MKEAYKSADGRKIEGRRVLVDVERGRTVETWKPRRLGGGLGAEGRAPRPPKKAPPGGFPALAPLAMDMDRAPLRAPPRELGVWTRFTRLAKKKPLSQNARDRDRGAEPKRRRDVEDGEMERRDRDREARRRVRD
ncbi:hypothetical protein DUNSADRAFT_18077 [Dunaliella salina]|uniref:Uncharacterized protein n=1 Tax=Dunaliella salina TaxID=3046 RepID=A0ABQ7G0R0_DUNSA|nr:hypothetical protein DUNSADRAFT_18077 [Dunaliella salina]|eukprot:KAF5828186.1 hypothetical protein DUNSADRAFT_18077 [Dunaliella salina]